MWGGVLEAWLQEEMALGFGRSPRQQPRLTVLRGIRASRRTFPCLVSAGGGTWPASGSQEAFPASSLTPFPTSQLIQVFCFLLKHYFLSFSPTKGSQASKLLASAKEGRT